MQSASPLAFSVLWNALCVMGILAAPTAAQGQSSVTLNIRPADPRVGEPIHAAFSCPDVGGLDRIDERRTRVRFVDGVIRMELFTRPDDSFGFCGQFIRLGWLPEGSWRLQLWFDGVFRAERTFDVLPPQQIPEGQRGPAYNFTGVYTARNRPGRNATFVQSVYGRTLSIILTGYDEQRRGTNWLLICEQWTHPRRCEGTVYESTGDPYTTATEFTNATLTPIGSGWFRDDSFDFFGFVVAMRLNGREYSDSFVPLRY